MKTNSIRISENGQLTIPKEIREILGTSLIHIEIDQQQNIKIIPIKKVAKIFKNYTNSVNKDFKEMREYSWSQEIERFGKNNNE